MGSAKVTWLALRVLRWIVTLVFVAYIIYISVYWRSLVNQFGHLPPAYELPIFFLFGGPFVIGLFELMMRERAGIPRPPYFSFRTPVG
ncbi:MAG TPA: hypothetical protein VKB08_17530 [Bradyrhizobium sp.]|nr:hypothetical protein [Bradyrhizobium sp.]